jgi:hypothetical protein
MLDESTLPSAGGPRCRRWPRRRSLASPDPAVVRLDVDARAVPLLLGPPTVRG